MSTSCRVLPWCQSAWLSSDLAAKLRRTERCGYQRSVHTTQAGIQCSSSDVICPIDDDFYHVFLDTGNVMTVDLTFNQQSDAGDLDLHLIDATGTDLTPCGPDNLDGCTAANGQGNVSNEHYVFTTPAGCDSTCDYYVVVRGFNGATNAYSIHIGVQ